MTNHIAFRKKALGSFFWLFLLQKLPLAFLAGVKLTKMDDDGAEATLKFKWLNQNPFRSIYFAAMQMAAELTTGLLLFQFRSAETPFSMLLVSVTANYHKKAIGKTRYTCKNGPEAAQYIPRMMKSEDGEIIIFSVEATNESNELIADFQFRWSCKASKA
jgi:hypothetical protein